MLMPFVQCCIALTYSCSLPGALETVVDRKPSVAKRKREEGGDERMGTVAGSSRSSSSATKRVKDKQSGDVARDACTVFELERVCEGQDDTHSIVKCSPVTGRTHQVREGCARLQMVVSCVSCGWVALSGISACALTQTFQARFRCSLTEVGAIVSRLLVQFNPLQAKQLCAFSPQHPKGNMVLGQDVAPHQLMLTGHKC